MQMRVGRDGCGVDNWPYRYEIFSLVTLRANTGLRIFLIWQIFINPSTRFGI